MRCFNGPWVTHGAERKIKMATIEEKKLVPKLYSRAKVYLTVPFINRNPSSNSPPRSRQLFCFTRNGFLSVVFFFSIKKNVLKTDRQYQVMLLRIRADVIAKQQQTKTLCELCPILIASRLAGRVVSVGSLIVAGSNGDNSFQLIIFCNWCSTFKALLSGFTFKAIVFFFFKCIFGYMICQSVGRPREVDIGSLISSRRIELASGQTRLKSSMRW